MIASVPRLLWIVWISILAVKLALGLSFSLSFDEAYYWTWSLLPSWSYYDHPAMVSWIMTVGTWVRGGLESLTGFKLDAAVRWPFIMLAHATLLIADQVFVLLAQRFAATTHANTATTAGATPSTLDRSALILILSLSPLVGVGALIATPDLPRVLFATVSGFLALHWNSYSSEHSNQPHSSSW